jgi:hypothetical protein
MSFDLLVDCYSVLNVTVLLKKKTQKYKVYDY